MSAIVFPSLSSSSSSAFFPPHLPLQYYSPNSPIPPSLTSAPRPPTHHLLRVRAANPTSHVQSNFYDVLRLKQSATQKEIKAAYRTLAKQFHPDAIRSRPTGKAQSSSDHDEGISSFRDFTEIQRAYAMLSDPPTRAAYDRSISIRCCFSSHFHTGNTSTKRWETDQCW